MAWWKWLNSRICVTWSEAAAPQESLSLKGPLSKKDKCYVRVQRTKAVHCTVWIVRYSVQQVMYSVRGVSNVHCAAHSVQLAK